MKSFPEVTNPPGLLTTCQPYATIPKFSRPWKLMVKMPTLSWTSVLPGLAHLQPCQRLTLQPCQRLDQLNQKAPARNPCSDSDCLPCQARCNHEPFIPPFPLAPPSTLDPKTELTSLLRRLHIGLHRLLLAAAEAPEVRRELAGGLHKDGRLRLQI